MTSITRMTSYLFRFMLIFEIDRFWIFHASSEKITARVGWADDGALGYDADDEVQDIEWRIQNFDNFDDALKLSEYLIDHNLVHSDRIAVDAEDICERISWGQARYNAALDTLLRIRVDMLDDGRKTDYFFVHT